MRKKIAIERPDLEQNIVWNSELSVKSIKNGTNGENYKHLVLEINFFLFII